MVPPASGPLTRSHSGKNAAAAHEAGAGEEVGENEAPPAVESRFSESSSEEDQEVDDMSGPAPTSGTTTPEPAPASKEMAVESPDPADEIPTVDVGVAAETAMRKDENGLDVDGVEESSTDAATRYHIPKKKDEPAEKAAKPSVPVSVARNGHRAWQSGPVTYKNGLPFLTARALGIDVTSRATEGYTVVIEGLELSAATPEAAVQGFMGVMHEIMMFDGPKTAEDINRIEAHGGRVFVTFKNPATCSMFIDHVGPALQQNHDHIQHQLRPIAAHGVYVLVRAWMCRKRYRDMSAYAPSGRGRGRGRSSGHSSGRSHGKGKGDRSRGNELP